MVQRQLVSGVWLIGESKLLIGVNVNGCLSLRVTLVFLFGNPINESGFCSCEENGTCLTAL